MKVKLLLQHKRTFSLTGSAGTSRGSMVMKSVMNVPWLWFQKGS